jgi:hypothetical protein
MHNNLLIVAAAAGVGLATFAVLPAQEPSPEIQFRTNKLIRAVNGNTITGAPYSAEAVTETTQSLGDGNQIAKSSSVKVYRDSQGRERREENEPFQRVFVYDPVAGTNLSIDPQARTVERSAGGALGRGVAGIALARGARGNGIPQGTITVPDGRLGTITVTGRMISGSATPAPLSEDLGSKSIEGVYAKGSRNTVTIPAGQIGNREPIQVVDEIWYSPDLQMNVTTRHSDPRSGEVVYQLRNVSRAEPDAALFQAPADYKVKDSQTPGFITCREDSDNRVKCANVAP